MQNQGSCFKWNNHASDISSLLGTFQQKGMLVDVTLSCQGENIKAHKIILAACSPYFQNIFMQNPCQHPIIPIIGVKFEDIRGILNFMYKGEVNIPHGGLSSFLQAAEALKIKGLAEMRGEKRCSNSISKEVQQSELSRPIVNEDQEYDVESISDTTDSSVKMQIFVENSHTNKIVALEVEPSDTIKKVREKIPKAFFENEEGISSDDHLLIFANKRLRDCRTISDCKIENGSKLLLVWPLPLSMRINVGIPDGKTIDLQVSTSSTIENVKAKIQDKILIPTCQQCLMFAGKILEDGHTLQDYNILPINIKDGYRLYLELRLKENMQIFVRMWNGGSRTFEVEPTDTIESLKVKIQDKEGIEPRQQRILFACKVLDEARTFADYNIRNESVLHIAIPPSLIRAAFPPGHCHLHNK